MNTNNLIMYLKYKNIKDSRTLKLLLQSKPFQNQESRFFDWCVFSFLSFPWKVPYELLLMLYLSIVQFLLFYNKINLTFLFLSPFFYINHLIFYCILISISFFIHLNVGNYFIFFFFLSLKSFIQILIVWII